MTETAASDVVSGARDSAPRPLPAPPHPPIVVPSRALRWTLHASVLAPAAILVAIEARALAQLDGAPASTALALIGAALALVGLALPPSRRLAVDVGGLIASRVGFVPLLLAALVALLVASARDQEPAFALAAAWLFFLAIGAAEIARARNRRRFAFTCAALVMNAAIVISADLALRIFKLPNLSQNRLFVEYDAILGWKLRSSLSIMRKNESYEARETTNALGFRGKDVPVEKRAGTRRIVALGDSFTEGYTVSDDDTYAARLEQILGERAPTEVLSFGVGGYSTDQELLSYVHYARRFKPDVVTLQFCFNDPPWNVRDCYGTRGMKPLFTRHGDLLLLGNVPVPQRRGSGIVSPRIVKLSAIALLLDDALEGLAISHDAEPAPDGDPESWAVTDLLIRDLDHMVRADGAKLVVWNAIPSPDLDRRLHQILDPRGITLLDANEAFPNGPKGCFARDGHWNKKGNDLIARWLARKIEPLLPSMMGLDDGAR